MAWLFTPRGIEFCGNDGKRTLFWQADIEILYYIMCHLCNALYAIQNPLHFIIRAAVNVISVIKSWFISTLHSTTFIMQYRMYIIHYVFICRMCMDLDECATL